MFTRRSLIGIALVSSAIAAMPVLAQDQATVGIQTTTHYSIDGRISGRRYQRPYRDHHLGRRHRADAECEPGGRQYHEHQGRRQR